MYVTNDPNDKYAFLFSGSKAERYENDIKLVFDTLTQYYGYPKGNIWVVFGDGNTTPPNTIDATYFTNANYVDITDQVSLDTALSAFTTLVSTNNSAFEALAGPRKTAVVYITGEGDTGGLNINSSGIILDTTWFNDSLNQPPAVWPDPPPPSHLRNCYVYTIMQQGYGGQFFDNFGTSLGQKSFISACGSGESMLIDEDGDSNGSFFTLALMKGLRFEKLPADATPPDKYADELGAGVEFIIDLKESFDFAVAYLQAASTDSVTKTPVHVSGGGDVPHCLGRPDFRIRDGDELPAPETRGWWESPDIWITNDDYPAATSEDNDYYMYDNTSNKIHVRVNVEGTHPVRLIHMGGKVFVSGGGGPANPYLIGDLVSLQILKPGENDTMLFDYNFDLGVTHRCIRAKAGLTDFTGEQSSMDEDTDWDPHQRQEEAQRNTDPSPLKSGGGADTDTGEAKVDEEAPEEEAAPVTDPDPDPVTDPDPDDPVTDPDPDPVTDPDPAPDTDTKSTNNLRGAKEHIYVIKNNFRYSRDFRYRIDPVLFKREKEFRFNWCRIDPGYKEKYQKLIPVMKPYPHIGFQLKPGEEAHIVNHIGIRKEAKIKEPVNLRFEIEMGAERIRRFLCMRLNSVLRMSFIPFSGVTMRIFEASFSMSGMVKSSAGRLMPNVVVIAKTLNGRQSAAVMSDKEGQWAFKEINPDIYMVYAIYQKKASKEVYVHGMPVKKRRETKGIEIILDKDVK